MKRRVKLTESQLNRVIKESVKRALSGSGYVSCDGNSMVGGDFGWDTTWESKNILEDFLETLSERDVLSDDELDDFEYYCSKNEAAFEIEARLSLEYDESTDYGSSLYPCVELEDFSGDEKALDYVAKYPNHKVATIAVQVLEDMFQNLTGEDFYVYT